MDMSLFSYQLLKQWTDFYEILYEHYIIRGTTNA